METIDYQKQGKDFLEKHNVTMSVKFLYNGPYFDDEKESRDIYEITLSRPGKKPYTFRFGQSIQNSGLMVKRNPHGKTLYDQEMIPRRYAYEKRKHSFMFGPSEKDRIVPTAYDVLTCLTKNEPGTFEDFCSDYGYDTDSRKAEKTYFAVQQEYISLKKIFSQTELDEMQEIQ